MSTSDEYGKLSDSAKKKEDWMNTKWRPMMGWTYMATCIADFVLFPILWSVIQAIHGGQVNVQWQPITLQGAGLFHIAMGAILGIAVYGRTKEKLEGATGNGTGFALPPNVGTTYTPPTAMGQQPGNFGTPMATTVTQTYGSPTAMPTRSFSTPMARPAATFTSASGKVGPVLDDEPEL
jgi:hypothetical protein